MSILLTLAISTMLSMTCDAQVMVKVGKKFFYDNEVYSRKNLGPIFEDSEQAQAYYLKARKNARTSVRTRNSAIIPLGLTILCVKQSQNRNDLGTSITWALGALITGANTVVLSIISLGSYTGANANYNNAVNHFNWENGHTPAKENSHLQLGITNNGLGLVYQF